MTERQTTLPPAKPAYDPVDVTSLAFWSKTPDEREAAFQVLRDERPVSWHPPAEGGLMPHDGDPGLWAVVRHADIVAVSRNPEVFCSGRGVMFEDIPEAILEAAQSFLPLDAPRHTKLRRLVSTAFTPRRVAMIGEQIRAHAARIVDDLAGTGGTGDFVADVAMRLPMATIATMMGVPAPDHAAVVSAANELVGWNDPQILGERNPLELMASGLVTLTTVALAMAQERRQRPTDDLMTGLVQAEVDGENLTDEETGAFFILLSVAGNDTTRNTISHAMKAFCDHPDQRARLAAEFDRLIHPAVEEMIRWATPVMTFRRTATRDVDLRGQPISEGDKVVMFYHAANRDDRAFDHPERFDIARDPNPHVGFGGGGPHFCLGAALARLQLEAIFRELFERVADLEVGRPQYLVSNFINGISSLPCTFGTVRERETT